MRRKTKKLTRVVLIIWRQRGKAIRSILERSKMRMTMMKIMRLILKMQISMMEQIR